METHYKIPTVICGSELIAEIPQQRKKNVRCLCKPCEFFIFLYH